MACREALDEYKRRVAEEPHLKKAMLSKSITQAHKGRQGRPTTVLKRPPNPYVLFANEHMKGEKCDPRLAFSDSFEEGLKSGQDVFRYYLRLTMVISCPRIQGLKQF